MTEAEKTFAEQLLAIIPDVSVAQMAFPAGKGMDDVYDKLKPIAKQWEEGGEDDWGTEFFGKLFYGGGIVPDRNEDVASEEESSRVLRWVRGAMGSYYPKHEDKTRVCGMLWQTFFLKPEEE